MQSTQEKAGVHTNNMNDTPNQHIAENRGIARKALEASRPLRSDVRRSWSNLCASVRTLLLALIVSVLMGAAAWAFLAALAAATRTREHNPWLFALLPLVGIATAWLYRHVGLRAARGNNLVIDSSLTGTPIHARMAPLTFICSVATHLVGGSAGREGTAVQIGGTIASNVAGACKLSGRERQDLMLAGISSAFGAVFGAPLAGAFFGMEVCTVGKLSYGAVLYCLAASYTADATARLLGVEHAARSIAAVPALSLRTVIICGCAAVLFGCAARLFSLGIRTVKHFYATRFRGYLAAALLGSLVVLGAYALLSAWRYAGLSEWLIGAGFAGTTTLTDVAFKLVLTALTLGAGFQGGEVTPLFGIGAALGGWLGTALGVEPSFMAALGMCAVFGSALNVPLTTVMLSLDMFHGAGVAYFVSVSFISYLVAGHRGIYPAQRIATAKCRTLVCDQGDTIEAALDRRRDPSRQSARTSNSEAQEG